VVINLIKKLKILLVGSIFLISLPVKGDWIKIAESNIGVKYFFDYEYVSKKEDLVLFTILENHKVKTPGGHLSTLLYMQGNCENSSIKWSKGEFSKKSYDFQKDWFLDVPKLLYISNPEWQYVSYESPWGKALKKACEFKL
tara:strand:+ start:985 stop:1407 length:423 start_codon:yes stop_codon:yes gene_type:complete